MVSGHPGTARRVTGICGKACREFETGLVDGASSTLLAWTKRGLNGRKVATVSR
jgi:hypothetical protein